jgi:hypothetical protein
MLLHTPNGANLPWLVKEASKCYKDLKPKAIYYRLRRLLLAWSKQGIISLEKVDGLLTAKPLRVDLIIRLAKLKPANRKSGRHINKWRLEAKRLLMEFRSLSEVEWETLTFLFLSYLDDVNERLIVLKNSLEDPPYLLIPYKHRFRKERLREIKKLYEELWDKLSEGCTHGVFLTCTIDPSKYHSLYEIVEAVAKAFNRLMSWIKKKCGFRPHYIAVNEFQDSGRLHIHIILFGISRLADKFSELTPELERVGFGKISYIYQIKRSSRGKWVWSQDKPKESRLNPRDYLMKYLSKAIYLPQEVEKLPLECKKIGAGKLPLEYQKVAMYWATNKRFFSHSRLPKEGERLLIVEKKVEAIPVGYGWVFVGSFTIWDIPMEIVELSLNPEIFYKYFGG